MGFVSGLVKVVAISGCGLYFLGRHGLRTCARYAGYTMGHSLGRMRRSRRAMQAKFTEEQSPERQQAAKEMQRGWWELRMILNEWAMMRSLNPRLLQGGNFGFTDAEIMQAIGLSTVEMDHLKQKREAQRDRHIDLDRQQLENPRMYPIAGYHGTKDDATAFQEFQKENQDDPSGNTAAGMDPLTGNVYFGSDTYTKGYPAHSNKITAPQQKQTHQEQWNYTDNEDPSVVKVTRPDGFSYGTRMNVSYRRTARDSHLQTLFPSMTDQAPHQLQQREASHPVNQQPGEHKSGSSLMKEVVEDTAAMEYMARVETRGKG